MASKSPARASSDAIQMLTEDHNKVKALFKQFEKLKEQDDADEEISDLVAQICAELTIHSTIEEEIFYPAMREAIDDDDLLDEADVEHASAKELIGQLESMSPGDDHYDAKVVVLGEYIDHHVKEEEGEMFPMARKADMDLDALGKKLRERKGELESAPARATRRTSRTATKSAASTNGRRPAAKTAARKSTAQSRRH